MLEKKKSETVEEQGNYEISIRGSDFLKFTLKLTQAILDIQEDNASKLQSK